MGYLSLLLALGILLGVVGAAAGLGLAVHRLESRRGLIDHRGRPLVDTGMGGALGFLSASAAFLLGVLLLTSINHYNATEQVVSREALNYAAAFDGAAGLAPTDTAKIHRDLVCLMRSVATKSWIATHDQDLTGSENSHAWRARALADANAVVPTTKVQENSLGTVHSELLDASKAGQERLLAAASNLPTALWALVYVSIFVLAFSLTLALRPDPILTVAALAAVLVLCAAMVWVLGSFAEPFSKHDGVYISPRALNSVMVRLEGSYPGAAWAPCEELAAS